MLNSILIVMHIKNKLDILKTRICVLCPLQLFLSAGIKTFPIRPGQLQRGPPAPGLDQWGQLVCVGRHAAIGSVPASAPARVILCQSGPARVFHHQLNDWEAPRRRRGSYHASTWTLLTPARFLTIGILYPTMQRSTEWLWSVRSCAEL